MVCIDCSPILEVRLRSVRFSCSGWFWFRLILRLKLLRSDPNVVFGSSILLGSFSLVCFTTTSFAGACRPNHLHWKPGRGKLPVPVEAWFASSSRDPLRSLLSSRTVMLTGRGLFLFFKVRRIGGSSSGWGNGLTEGGMSGFSPSIARSSARLVLHRWTTSGQPCLFGVEVGRRSLFELVAANIQSLQGLVELSWGQSLWFGVSCCRPGRRTCSVLFCYPGAETHVQAFARPPHEVLLHFPQKQHYNLFP